MSMCAISPFLKRCTCSTVPSEILVPSIARTTWLMRTSPFAYSSPDFCCNRADGKTLTLNEAWDSYRKAKEARRLQQALVASQPFPSRGGLITVAGRCDGDFWYVNLQAADHQSKLRLSGVPPKCQNATVTTLCYHQSSLVPMSHSASR